MTADESRLTADLAQRAAADLGQMTTVYHYAVHPLSNPFECPVGLCPQMFQRVAELRSAADS